MGAHPLNGQGEDDDGVGCGKDGGLLGNLWQRERQRYRDAAPQTTPGQNRNRAAREGAEPAEKQHRRADGSKVRDQRQRNGHGHQPGEVGLEAEHEHLQSDQQEQDRVQHLVVQRPEAGEIACICSLSASPRPRLAISNPATTTANGPPMCNLLATA